MLHRFLEIYRYRVLVDVLVQRELKARYRGTVLGLLWSFVNPLLLMIIYTLVFKIYMRVDMRNYSAYLLSGMLPWNCFVTGLLEGTGSIIASGGLIKKVYLPSEIFPLVSVFSNLVHFLLSIPILIGLILYSGVPITWAWINLPIVVVLQVMFTYGVVLLASATAVKYRDLLHVIPNVLMVLFFTSPVLYPQENVPPDFRFLLDYNPLSYLVEAYHQILFDGVMLPPLELGRLLIFGVIALVLGMWVFDGRRDHFAESI